MAETTGTTSGRSRLLTGLFRDRESAERACELLATRGYGRDDVSLLMSDQTHNEHFASGRETELGNKALEGLGKGAAIGGTVGATLAAIAAIGTNVALPGLGLVVAGPIVAGLAGAGMGGASGGIIGALIGSGIPEERVQQFEQGIREGGIVLGFSARTDEDADFFKREIQAFDPHGTGWGENR